MSYKWRIGVDAGATLWKLVRYTNDLDQVSFPANSIDPVRQQLTQWNAQSCALTGCHASQLASCFKHGTRIESHTVDEFEAWGLGAGWLARRAGAELPRRYIVLSVGTGSFLVEVEHTRSQRVAGSRFGGGTLLGLGRLLTGNSDFQAIVDLAARGDRIGVDLMVRELYPSGLCDLPKDAVAASFAKLGKLSREDMASALLHMIGEEIGALCVRVARERGVDTVIAGGTTLSDKLLARILNDVMTANGLRLLLPAGGAYIGAVGALLATGGVRHE